MRQQPGTTSLRAIVYMDEIFGYFPPVANPPSKPPLLTLLKQARAFGVGVMLATQNPVDLDYKGLGNAGHVVHRPAADRARQGAAARRPRRRGRRARRGGSTAGRWSRRSPGLGNRVFLMNNVHEDGPVAVRDALGDVLPARAADAAQIKPLMDPRKAAAIAAGRAVARRPSATRRTGGTAARTRRLAAAAQPSRAGPAAGGPAILRPGPLEPPEGATLVYRPALLGFAAASTSATRSSARTQTQEVALLLPLDATTRPADWDARRRRRDLRRRTSTATRGDGARRSRRSRRERGSREELRRLAEGVGRLALPHADARPVPQPVARRNVTAGRVEARLPRPAAAGRRGSGATRLVEKLRQKYAPKLASLAERPAARSRPSTARPSRRAQSKVQTAISFGTTVLGRRSSAARPSAPARSAAPRPPRAAPAGPTRSRRTSPAPRRRSPRYSSRWRTSTRSSRRKSPSSRRARPRPPNRLETISVRPKKSDIDPRAVALASAPHLEPPGTPPEPAW